MHNLSIGALMRYASRNPSEKPILQVLTIKPMESTTGDQLRYRMQLSDGKHFLRSCILGTQLNYLVADNSLQDNSIVRIERAFCTDINRQIGKLVLQVQDLTVVAQSVKIGNPISLQINVDQRNSTEVLQAHLVSEVSASSTGNRHIINAPNKEVTAFGQKPNRIFTIDILNPYQNKWTIRARVANKTNVRTFQNTRGNGKLFSCDLMDETGEIRATAFGDECDKLYAVLEIDEVYYISKAILKSANKQYNHLDNDYEMTFNHDTEIQRCSEPTNIPTIQYHFTPINEIEQKQANSLIDVIGIVKSVSNTQQIVSKQSNKEFTKREIVLCDQTASINITLWNEQAEAFDGSTQPVVAFKRIKLTNYNGRSLSVVNSTNIKINIDLREAHILRTWFDNDGYNVELPSLSILRNAETNPITTDNEFKTLGQIVDENLGINNRVDYIQVKAVCNHIKKDLTVYTACPNVDCNKKVIENGDGTFHCEKCNKDYNDYRYVYMAQCEISDVTGSQWISVFGTQAETLLGVSAEQFGNAKYGDDEGLIKIIIKAQYKEKIFRLRAKVETYNNENRLRLTCLRVQDVNYVKNAQQIIKDISRLFTT